MRILVTGASGYVGGALLERLARDRHDLVAFARDRRRVGGGIRVVEGDAVTGAGLDAALDGAEVAYFLIHSMEAGAPGAFVAREQEAARRFARAAVRAGTRRVVYLGGLVPAGAAPSAHLGSRLAVEETLLAEAPDPVALRASIVIGAGSRSFRFLVRLVERLPVLALPAWRDRRTAPIDGRDVLEYLAAAASEPAAGGRSLDIAGPDVLTYGEIVERIRDLMLVGRPSVGLPVSLTPITSRIGAVIGSEDASLIRPLMDGLETDLLPRTDEARTLFRVRLHRFAAAVERALRDWEAVEPVAAR